jgi:hypothetical protein
MNQQGIATLLLTTLMLSLAFLVVGRSALVSRYQLRDVQDDVKSSQSFWLAEGELECLWTQEHSSYTGEQLPDECRNIKHESWLSAPHEKLLTVSVGSTTLQKRYALPLPDVSGVIKTTSHLVLTQNAMFAPDPGSSVSENHWRCMVLRYKYDFFAPSVTTYHPEQLPYQPYTGFPQRAGQQCTEQYHSVGRDAQHVRSDYRHDPELFPFKDLFGIDVSHWFLVMSHSGVGRVPESLDEPVTGEIRYSDASRLPVSHLNADCASQIRDVILRGKMIIWVYGGCVLSDLDIRQINQAVESEFPHHGIILVIQDGLVGINSNHPLQGMLYQLLTPEHTGMPFHNWGKTSLLAEIKQSLSQLSPLLDIDLGQVNYFQVGSFYPSAGLVLDADQHFAIIQGEIDFHYRRDLLMKALSQVRPASWLGASWYEP